MKIVEVLLPGMRLYRRKQNIFFTLVLTFVFFALGAHSTSADWVSVSNFPSASSIMSEVESRYHLNLGALQNEGEAMNVSGNKFPAPEVSLFFSPSDPKSGEKLSVKAFPMYFSNEEGTMYYTWYLKRESCDDDGCDYNSDGRYDQKDWKIEAMRMLAQNGYERPEELDASDSDSDGYRAKFGGDNKVDVSDYCYVHDNDTGTNYELRSGCQHLFPNASGETTGDGSFGKDEEEFWGTNPEDSDTADNGNKDEANIAGLGQSTFVWNYAPGDEVGVAVEGSSILPTKHGNSSYMVMWAFPKKDCPPENLSSYATTISGYSVTIPTANMDLNDCIENNLVNPAEGGQPTNLDVSVSATPDNPINDETSDKGGDTIFAQASVSNSRRNLTDMSFEWTVEISRDISFSTKRDITSSLRDAGLLGNIRGNALDTIQIKLDMPRSMMSGYLSDGIGYLRFKSTVTENFSGGAIRKGKSDVIVKFVSTSKKISAYKAETELSSVSGAPMMKVTLDGATSMCNTDVLDRVACRVIKNEIIGLRIDSSGLSNFNWTLNGKPLICSRDTVSADCTDGEQNNVNFFPVTGNQGDTYTVSVTANDVSTGNVITLARTFGVVDPVVMIESLDRNIVWPKLLGQYRDITGTASACPDGLCNDYSTSMFEAFADSSLGFRATFVPGFLADIAQKEWSVDGQIIAESAPGEISFPAYKLPGEIFNVDLIAQVKQPDETRRALLDIWGISPFNSPEITFAVSNQVQLQSPMLANGPESGPRKYLAAIVSYIPVSVLFTFRVFLSAILMLFVASFLYTLLNDRRAAENSFLKGE